METFKILRMDEQQNVCGIVLEQKVTEIAKIIDFAITDEFEKKIIDIIRKHSDGKCEGHYLIASYNDNDEYVRCEGVLFGENPEEEDGEAFLDGAENDFRVACDMAHKTLTNKQKWRDIERVADQYNLMDNIIELINVWWEENEL